MGVAVIGSVFSSLFGPQIRHALGPLTNQGLSAAQLDVAQGSMQAAQATVAHFPSALQPSLDVKVTDAFMNGLHRGCLVAAAVAVAVALVVFFHLPAGRPRLASELILEG